MSTDRPIKLKVCGMRDAANIAQVAAEHPDYMGFIFYSGSPRFVGKDFSVPAGFPSNIARVGVFVNESVADMVRLVRALSLDYVQLHGAETADDCRALKHEGVGVIKAFSIGETFDWNTVLPYKGVVDYFLFDTKGKYHGGNARTFDWNILKGYDQEVPFFLSGGLTPGNINDVENLRGMNLHAVDVNSGVEDAPGVKSLVKLKALKQQLIS